MSDENSTEGPELRKVDITDVDLDALSHLVGVSQMEVPHPAVVRAIAEGTEVLLRRRLRQLARPKATLLEIAGAEDAPGELVVPLFGSAEEQTQLIQQIISLMLPGDESLEGLGASLQIAEEALKIALEYGILPEKAEQLMRVALAEAKRPDADGFYAKYECGHEVVWLGSAQEKCPHPDGEGGHCGAARTIWDQIMIAGWVETAVVLDQKKGPQPC